MADDLFALYAEKADDIGEGLSLPEPIPHSPVFCDLNACEFTPTTPMPVISNEEGLKQELTRLRGEYEPFLAELAPQAECKKKVFPVREFSVDGKNIFS